MSTALGAIQPSHHPEPELATSIIEKVVDLLAPYQQDFHPENQQWLATREQVDNLIFSYFGLNDNERQVVRDTCQYYIPSRQPASFASLHRPLHQKPLQRELQDYTRILHQELEVWRDRFSGKGEFSVELADLDLTAMQTMGVIRISLERDTKPARNFSQVFEVLMNELKAGSSYPTASEAGLTVASDFLLYQKPDYFLIKPMLKRLWLSNAAVHDAYRIVKTVRSVPRVQ